MGNLCSQPRQEEYVTRASVAFKQSYKNVEFENVNGDICTQDIDAIVNPANNQLSHNNGLSNTLVAKGGRIIQEESDKIMDETEGILDIGTAVVTTGGSLQAKHIVHVVSPIWNGGDNSEEEKLGLAVQNVLAKADHYKIKSLAVPCLSGGSFGFPREKYESPETSLELIRFVNMDAATVRAFKSELEKVMKNDMISPNKLRKNNETSFEQKTGDAAVPEAQHKSVEEETATQGAEPVVDTMLRSDIREEEVLLEKSPIDTNTTRDAEEVAN
jgi:O-acetyl-ADP-ribose deacetylase (regulator of RNase III)